jgi:tetratricopeptide (TPR) repeat protein
VGKVESLDAHYRLGESGRRWLFVGLGVLSIMGLLCLLVLVPAGVRALPGRYAARLPGFLQQFRHRPHPDVLPTPAVAVTPFLNPTLAPTIAHLSGVTFVTPASTRSESAAEMDNPEPSTPGATARSTDGPTHPPAQGENQPGDTATAPATPTHTPTRTPKATASPTAAAMPQLPISATLPSITHTYQTWNNCGPATISMALNYFDRSGTQADAAAVLKPDPEDKNVSPHEMAAYVRSLGLEATVRVGGDLARLKRLIAAGFPVVVETWFIPEPGDQMGHYRLLTGYDDQARRFIAQDSYNGPNVSLGYAAFDEMWRVFNRVYLVVHHPSRAHELAAILGGDLDDRVMYARALEIAHAEALNPSAECVAYEECSDGAAFAWFNVGSSLTSLGRHEEAAAAYDQARQLGLPWRMLWYQFGPYEAYYAVERFDDVITLATVTLNTTDNLEESYYWRGVAYGARGKTDRARADFQAALEYNPGYVAAKQALATLE